MGARRGGRYATPSRAQSSKLKARYDLARPGLGASVGTDPSIDPVHIAEAGRQQTLVAAQAIVVDWDSGNESRNPAKRRAIRRNGVEHTVKDVLEFRTNQELSSFLDVEDPPERHTLGGLALPTKVVEVRR